jgi:hypothetical protein
MMLQFRAKSLPLGMPCIVHCKSGLAEVIDTAGLPRQETCACTLCVQQVWKTLHWWMMTRHRCGIKRQRGVEYTRCGSRLHTNIRFIICCAVQHPVTRLTDCASACHSNDLGRYLLPAQQRCVDPSAIFFLVSRGAFFPLNHPRASQQRAKSRNEPRSREPAWISSLQSAYRRELDTLGYNLLDGSFQSQ